MSISRKQFLQQSAFALAGTCLPISKLFAKDFHFKRTILDTFHPKNCGIDLATDYKYTYNSDKSQSQVKWLEDYYSFPDATSNNTVNPINNDVMYALEGDGFDTETCNPAVTRCSNVDFTDSNPFHYRVYYPDDQLHDYANKPLPAVIFFHAGGFQECSVYGDPVIINMCIELSRKGFICYTVEYRRGRIIDFNNYPNPLDVSVQQQMARYRGIQDGCGAIRTIMKKNIDGVYNFRFNPNQFFVGGDSAGGIIALGCVYYRNQSMIDMAFPKDPSSTYEIKQVLGNMQVNMYYAPINNPDYWPTFAGVISMWGGIVIPKSYDGNLVIGTDTDRGVVESTFFTQGNPGTYDKPPIICFHGAKDKVIPYYDSNGKQDINLSPLKSGQNYNSETLCTNLNRPYIQLADPNNVELKMCSSLNMYYIMKQLNRFTELYTDCSMGHGLDDDCSCIGGITKPKNGTCVTCAPYASNFGTAATNQAQTTVYMAARVATFLQAIMANSPNVLTFGAKGRSYFKDCENYRSCFVNNGAESNACGSDETPDTLCDGSSLF